ncbi:IS200/IS605 family transposase [Actinoplanes sp. NPDC049802]|uniref:IS200/IS605 family transposase n=1 Tax=Actinoplanes sp. NPDC049802 TaxID=3154742 RepID=UPI0033ECAEFE
MAREVQVCAGAADGLGYHVVWCPKYRRPVLTPPVTACCDELIRVKCAADGWRVIVLEVMPGHVRLFVTAHPADSPAHVANQVKGFTSRVLRAEFAELRSKLPTLWSRSYLAATVQRYIDTQYGRPWRKRRAR